MNKITLLFLSLFCGQLFAQNSQCTTNPDYLKAEYKITQSAAPKQDKKMILWRSKEQVAHEFSKITELWQHVRNGQIRPIRYFEDAKRGIEYQPAELKKDQNWDSKYQLMSEAFLQQMEVVGEQGFGCDKVQLRTFKKADYQVQLEWYPALKLVKSARLKNQHNTTQIELINKNTNLKEIKQQFAAWDRYQTTDYADIGDNEADPFLRKMINLGFIEHGATGFYHEDGHALGGGHHNHGH
ncbi:hypothetical protein [Catenovulum adriaticum]|uniref:Uncharacterized protein n=1 Tax=Catenovulum adriaticum TaxID=2984846 RepID=A0ABY7AMD6_9ALTE|nr:hypothetical protein [Catenovulum sp. TS8]WAJ70311.1 hypothetical protein OLW01_00405 [Catenovulum sp. TS8]